MENLKKGLLEVVFMEFVTVIGLLFTDIEKQMIVTVIGLVFIGFVAGKLYSAMNNKKKKEEQKRNDNSKKKFYYKKKKGNRK